MTLQLQGERQAEVELVNINKWYGSFQAAYDINLQIEKGSLVGILGPSGGGKTTILRMIAGLETPSNGDIYIGGARVNDMNPGKRNIGFVFQNYALFKHMTVEENIAFGLDLQSIPKKEKENRVTELIELIGLAGCEKRYPAQLSGGQKQRVAFARALAPKPRVLLLDEPFAAIDAKVRKSLREWLRHTIEQIGVTGIFVTHDQDEAVEMAHHIVVVNKGHIEQVGTPADIYKNPKTSFVAHFIGQASEVENVHLFKGFNEQPAGISGIIRPEFLELGASEEESGKPASSEKGVVKSVFFRGGALQVDVEVNGQLLSCMRSLEKPIVFVGDEVFVFIHRILTISGGGTEVVENSMKLVDESAYI